LFWLYLTIAIVVGLIFFSLALYWLILWLGKREPYGAFLRLRTWQKLTFFRLLLQDRERQIPLYVKLIPVVLVVLHLLCQARGAKPLPTEGEGSEREISLL
jgi:hypothetical protein